MKVKTKQRQNRGCYRRLRVKRRAALLNIFSLLLLFLSFSAGAAWAKKASIDQSGMTPELKKTALDYCSESLLRTISVVGDSFPEATENGVWKINSGGWTGGYFAGMLWMMYQATGGGNWLLQARRYTDLLEGNQFDVDNIDIGILFWPSFDKGYMITGDRRYHEIGIAGARTMMKRFNERGGYFQNWGRLGEREQAGFVIVDCLINLDHLFWASRETGDPSIAACAVSHARKTAESHVRDDGSSYQVVEFDQDTGKMLRGLKKQGYSDESTWSRGQSWGVYGFSRAYKNSGMQEFLMAAKRMADWFIDHLPPDFVPYWDFQAPKIPDDARDTSAASMAASGLIELATQVKDTGERRRYREAAEKIMASLTRSYLTKNLPGRNDGVLTGGTYFYEKNASVNQANIWGDFYYLEALLRLDGKVN
ncbi:MAG TPA: glycoside hydrolase family 88 protein [archaeon]|nr:glycoside hydrolase family 88 protein [archaeon]